MALCKSIALYSHPHPSLHTHPEHLTANSARKCLIWPAEYCKGKNSSFHDFGLSKHSQVCCCLLFLSVVISYSFPFPHFNYITSWPLKALEFGPLQRGMVPKKERPIIVRCSVWHTEKQTCMLPTSLLSLTILQHLPPAWPVSLSFSGPSWYPTPESRWAQAGVYEEFLAYDVG